MHIKHPNMPLAFDVVATLLAWLGLARLGVGDVFHRVHTVRVHLPCLGYSFSIVAYASIFHAWGPLSPLLSPDVLHVRLHVSLNMYLHPTVIHEPGKFLYIAVI